VFELKRLSPEAVPAALEKAERYRLLNEPLEAECICRDVLDADPTNKRAKVTLVLALTDQFARRMAEKFHQARELALELEDEYSRAYYQGILCERRAKFSLDQATPGSGAVAFEWFREAMAHYERAADLRPAGNDDPILRWNTCARVLNRRPDLQPAPESASQDMLE
jgi:tetratricopeptide (TPR) repeat protein